MVGLLTNVSIAERSAKRRTGRFIRQFTNLRPAVQTGVQLGTPKGVSLDGQSVKPATTRTIRTEETCTCGAMFQPLMSCGCQITKEPGTAMLLSYCLLVSQRHRDQLRDYYI